MPRKLIRVAGSDHVSFLQGLITNDMAKLADGLVYAALLTPQGKYLADFFVVPDGDGVLIDIDERIAEPTAKRFMMYKLRADVTLDWDDRVVSQGVGDAPEGAFVDPRDPSLGWRAYGAAEATLEGWDALRVAAAVPEYGTELGPDSYILEMGFERLNGVDFKKGCYVGQEVTARMKHKTELRKGLAKVAIDGTAEVGTPITVNGKEAGALHTSAGDTALAYVRFDRMSAPGQAGDATVTLLEKA